MTLELRIKALAASIAADIRALQVGQGNLDSLATTDKTSLVGALNEIKSAIADLVASGAGIDDSASGTTSTWSSAKINEAISSAIANLIGSAPSTLDTLGEIAALLNDPNAGLGALLTAVGNKVDYANAQSLSTSQKLQACTNIGVGDPDSDLVAYYLAQKG